VNETVLDQPFCLILGAVAILGIYLAFKILISTSSDLYPFQFALNDQGYRVCTYDYPGTGWSGFGVEASQPMILDKIIDAIDEPGPFVLLVTNLSKIKTYILGNNGRRPRTNSLIWPPIFL
jgi:hypothetical protein